MNLHAPLYFISQGVWSDDVWSGDMGDLHVRTAAPAQQEGHSKYHQSCTKQET